jgi:meiotic recombination protein SPO11
MDAVERIEGNLKRGESGYLLLVNRQKSKYIIMNRFFDDENQQTGETNIHFKRVCINSARCQIYLFLLKKIQKLLIQNEINTKRDLFYQNVNLFKNQAVVDQGVEDIACSFGIKRDQLNVIASGKGLVRGKVQLELLNGTVLDCSSQVVLIPPPHEVFRDNKIQKISGNYSEILVIEKDATFQSLIQSDFILEQSHIVLLTVIIIE